MPRCAASAWGRLWMLIWVIGGKALGLRGSDEVIVGGYHRQSGETNSKSRRVGIKSCRKLNRIVTTQPVVLRETHSVVEHLCTDRHSFVLVDRLLDEQTEERIAL